MDEKEEPRAKMMMEGKRILLALAIADVKKALISTGVLPEEQTIEPEKIVMLMHEMNRINREKKARETKLRMSVDLAFNPNVPKEAEEKYGEAMAYQLRQLWGGNRLGEKS